GVFSGAGGQLPAERLVDIQQPLLRALGELRVGEHRRPHARVRSPVLQDPRLHVKRFSGDPQALGYLLQDLGAWPAQPALDLAEVRVGHPSRRGKLPQRDLGLLSLRADVLADGTYVYGIHIYMLATLLAIANAQQAPLGWPGGPRQHRTQIRSGIRVSLVSE